MNPLLTHIVLALTFVNQAPTSDLGPILAKLAATDVTAQTEAAGVLEEQGRAALPALRAFEASAAPEPKARARALIDLIEQQRLLRATPVRLDLKDTSIATGLAELSRISGYRVELGLAEAAVKRTVSLRTDAEVGFWEALDRLAEASKLAPDRAALGMANHDGSSIVLIKDDRPTPPSGYAGPYAVRLVRLARERRTTLAPVAANSKTVGSITATLGLDAEPGLYATPIGPAVIVEAVDDLGQDLTGRPAPIPAGSGPSRRPSAFNLDPIQIGGDASFEEQIPLRLPEKSGKAIRRLRGYLPIRVIARSGDTLEIPIATPPPADREFVLGETTIRVALVQIGSLQSTIRLSIRGASPSRTETPAGRRQATLTTFNPAFRAEDCITLLDAEGRTIPLTSPASPNIPQVLAVGGTIDAVLQSVPAARLRAIRPESPPPGPPARLIYSRCVGVLTEVPFDFNDLPMP